MVLVCIGERVLSGVDFDDFIVLVVDVLRDVLVVDILGMIELLDDGCIGVFRAV